MTSNSHYDVLKITPDAPQDVVRAAYRVLAQRLHPDVNPSPDAEQAMKRVNEAYAVLSDSQRRSQYDRGLLSTRGNKDIDEAVANYVKKRAKPTRNASQTPTSSTFKRSSAFNSFTTENTDVKVEKKIQPSSLRIFWGFLAALVLVVVLFNQSTEPDSAKKIVSGSTRVTPNAAEVRANQELLRLICDEKNIQGSDCLQAKNYPIRNEDGSACNVSLTNSKIEGRFLSSKQKLLLAVYWSDCEPHVSNWGGSLVFERSGASFIFKGYQQGLVFSQCMTKIGRGKDRLICDGGFTGQGYTETSLYEIVFSEKSVEKITPDRKILLSATDSVGARDFNQVDCAGGFQLFSVGAPRGTSIDNLIEFEAKFASDTTVSKVCKANAPPPKGWHKDVGAAAPNHAFVGESDISKGIFLLDLNTKRIVPKSDLVAR